MSDPLWQELADIFNRHRALRDSPGEHAVETGDDKHYIELSGIPLTAPGWFLVKVDVNGDLTFWGPIRQPEEE